jgi:hypothetical protein
MKKVFFLLVGILFLFSACTGDYKYVETDLNIESDGEDNIDANSSIEVDSNSIKAEADVNVGTDDGVVYVDLDKLNSFNLKDTSIETFSEKDIKVIFLKTSAILKKEITLVNVHKYGIVPGTLELKINKIVDGVPLDLNLDSFKIKNMSGSIIASKSFVTENHIVISVDIFTPILPGEKYMFNVDYKLSLDDGFEFDVIFNDSKDKVSTKYNDLINSLPDVSGDITLEEIGDELNINGEVNTDDDDEYSLETNVKFNSCTDFDKGHDYFVSSYVNVKSNFNDKNMFDYCVANTLYEQVCDGEVTSNILYNCEFGCKNGACIKGSVNEEINYDSSLKFERLEGDLIYILNSATDDIKILDLSVDSCDNIYGIKLVTGINKYKLTNCELILGKIYMASVELSTGIIGEDMIVKSSSVNQENVSGENIISFSGKIVDYFTKEPIKNVVQCCDGGDLSTDYNGKFSFKVDFDKLGDFKLYTFYENNYPYFGFGLQKNVDLYSPKEHYNFSLRIEDIEGETSFIDISGMSVVEIGDVYAYPQIDFIIDSDVSTDYFVFIKKKSTDDNVEFNGEGSKWYDDFAGGSGTFNFKTHHFVTDRLPLDYESVVSLNTENGEEAISPLFYVPLSQRGKDVYLAYFNGKFGWSLESSQDAKAKTDVKNFVLTDNFNFWEDQSSHNYKIDGVTFKGGYYCSGSKRINSVYDDTTGADMTLRLSNCAHGDGSVSLDMAVNPGADSIKLVVQESTGSSSFFVKIDGIDFGHYKLGFACEETELFFEGLSDVTADGVVNIELLEGVPESCDGDPQMTYLNIYSN